MNFKLSFFLFLLISSLVSAQGTITVKGSKPFSATENYIFICDKYAFTGELEVQIAKTDKGGILKLTITTSDNNTRISGGVYVDLVNADVIACTDKNVKESEEGKTTAYYYFTPTEFSKLKKTDIQSIRFIIKNNSKTFGNQTGYFTAMNRKNYFSTAYDKSKKTFDTAIAISHL